MTDTNPSDQSTSDHSSPAASALEIMAAFLANDLQDGELLVVGAAMPVAEVAVRLAHFTHGPNMELNFIGARMNAAHLHSLPTPEFGWDRRVVRWAESFSDTGHRFDRVKDWYRRVFFIGGVQVDPHGNTNLIGVGRTTPACASAAPVRWGRRHSAPTSVATTSC